MNRTLVKKVAIIGCGPRGLSALESLYKFYVSNGTNYKLKIIVFERTGNFGNGQVYDQNQTSYNWLNLSERGLTIPEREAIVVDDINIDGFPSFQTWAKYEHTSDKSIDVFPQRATLGNYLNERFQSIKTVIENNGSIETYTSLITSLKYSNSKFELISDEDDSFTADEVVLTIGHQPTYNSAQINKWKNFVSQNSNLSLITETYPIESTLESIPQDNNEIGLRGFGLAMIDLSRSIAHYFGGHFEIIDEFTQKMKFHPSKNSFYKIFPFSLNGLPMAPKPINKKVDDLFLPTTQHFNILKANLESATLNAKQIQSESFLIDVMAQVITSVFIGLKDKTVKHSYNSEEILAITKSWISEGTSSSEICLSENLNPVAIMTEYAGMATNTLPISLDYCIGQVWRHCHPTLYKQLSYKEFSEDVMSKIIGLDNKLKRLTFGPPLASIQQLLAMIESGVMNLKIVDDPDILCTEKGWHLDSEDDTAVVTTMINTVLDPPKVLEVKSNLVTQLLNDDYIKPIHSELGIETYVDGIVALSDTDKKIPLALLGRLAKGTLFGVDAILECFNQRSDNWAKGVVKRLNNVTEVVGDKPEPTV
ncbi:FAD/NAD(P)-binding protein [Flavobacterium litorale]|uniref:FAD/NAD(P)-binding protein n=1 Tax=Flavobacterium litorale TaxID=2856519 RepID=A0ABX8V674_9FLAO|nr:FAD/NAD(P)-binding protein [Flavobacterium litorale]QYJ68247.1 FAD/NAD(P)-binding protein [Flavobacterium litorale]